MAFSCTSRDRIELQGYLARVLDAHKGGKITQDRAIIILNRVIMAATADASTEFKTSIRLPVEDYALDLRNA